MKKANSIKEQTPKPSVQYGGGSVMVWGCFVYVSGEPQGCASRAAEGTSRERESQADKDCGENEDPQCHVSYRGSRSSEKSPNVRTGLIELSLAGRATEERG